MIMLGKISDFEKLQNYAMTFNEIRILLIHSESGFHCIRDNCGHFGVSLANGSVENGQIRCPVHGICFNITTGAVENRPWENCEQLKIIPLIEKDSAFWIDALD